MCNWRETYIGKQWRSEESRVVANVKDRSGVIEKRYLCRLPANVAGRFSQILSLQALPNKEKNKQHGCFVSAYVRLPPSLLLNVITNGRCFLKRAHSQIPHHPIRISKQTKCQTKTQWTFFNRQDIFVIPKLSVILSSSL